MDGLIAAMNWSAARNIFVQEADRFSSATCHEAALVVADCAPAKIVKAALPAPFPMVLHCPACTAQHIDAENPAAGWANPPHRSHLCSRCGHIWRPADVATTGVEAVQTHGEMDSPIIQARAEDWQGRILRGAQVVHLTFPGSDMAASTYGAARAFMHGEVPPGRTPEDAA